MFQVQEETQTQNGREPLKTREGPRQEGSSSLTLRILKGLSRMKQTSPVMFSPAMPLSMSRSGTPVFFSLSSKVWFTSSLCFSAEGFLLFLCQSLNATVVLLWVPAATRGFATTWSSPTSGSSESLASAGCLVRRRFLLRRAASMAPTGSARAAPG